MQFMGSEGIFGEAKKAGLGGEMEGDTSQEAQMFLLGALLPGAWGLTLFLSK